MKFGKNMSRIGKKPVKIEKGVEVKIEIMKLLRDQRKLKKPLIELINVN